MFCVVQYIGLVAAAFLNHKRCFRCFACDLSNLMSQSQSTWSMEWISHGSVQNRERKQSWRSDHSWNEICKHQFSKLLIWILDDWWTLTKHQSLIHIKQQKKSSATHFKLHIILIFFFECRTPCSRNIGARASLPKSLPSLLIKVRCHEGALTVISHVQAPVNRNLSSPSGPSRLPQQTLQVKRFSDSIWLKLTIAQIPVMISGPPGSGSGLKTIVATPRA